VGRLSLRETVASARCAPTAGHLALPILRRRALSVEEPSTPQAIRFALAVSGTADLNWVDFSSASGK